MPTGAMHSIKHSNRMLKQCPICSGKYLFLRLVKLIANGKQQQQKLVPLIRFSYL